MDSNRYTVYSNYTEIASYTTLKEAKAALVQESYRYDDVVTLTDMGTDKFMAHGGALYA